MYRDGSVYDEIDKVIYQIYQDYDIVSFCDMSMEPAINACSNILSRRNKYGMNLFDYEVSLIGHLEPVLMETFKYDILKSCDDE